MAVRPAPRPEAWLVAQLERVYEHRPELVTAAIHRALADDEALRWAVVVGAYRDRQINLGKAAELLGLHELALRARFLELGIPLRIGPEDSAEAEAEVTAARRYLDRALMAPTRLALLDNTVLSNFSTVRRPDLVQPILTLEEANGLLRSMIEAGYHSPVADLALLL